MAISNWPYENDNNRMTITLHVIGCGRAGKSLARLWADAGLFSIGQIVNRSIASARSTVEFIGQGRAAETLSSIGNGDWLMLAVPDGALAAIAEKLSEAAAEGALSRPALAFHISGAEPAETLRPIGCPVVSVHPVFPFGDPERAVENFSGSYALGEGDAAGLDSILPMFAAIGAETMRFNPTDKRRYHAATIAASNFLNVLDDLALGLAESAGLAPDKALKVIVSLQRAGLLGIERAGPMRALTGPIERGDRGVCERLSRTSGVAGNPLFMALARAAVDLAERKHGLPAGNTPNPLRAMFDESASTGAGGTDGGV